MPRTITLLRAALPVICPSCGAKISWQYAAPHVHFLCPACGHGVHLRNGYFRVLNVLSLVLVGLGAYAVGARGDLLFWSVILGFIPVAFVLTFITMRLFPPDTESTGDYRGILYGSQRREAEGDDRANRQNSVKAEDAAPDPRDHID
jgi:predicted RNA-binding Zn-ribbon protein involved in translation (DUF1610 family)